MSLLPAIVIALAGVTASPQGMPLSANFGAMAGGPSVLTVSQAAVHLEPISVQELVGDASQPLASATLQADFDGTAIIGRGEISPAPLPSVIRRPLRGLWRLSVPTGGLRQERVKVALEGIDGSPGVLSSSDDPRVQMSVAVMELAPRTVSMSADHMQLEGGIVLEIPTAALGSATHFRGRLVIRVEGY